MVPPKRMRFASYTFGRPRARRSPHIDVRRSPRPVKSAIVVFPGTNRERDVAIALQRATGQRPAILWHRETELFRTEPIS